MLGSGNKPALETGYSMAPGAVSAVQPADHSRGGSAAAPQKRAKIWTISFFLIVAAGIFLRFYKLEHKEYWCDEAYTSLMISGHTREQFRDTVCTGQPLLAKDLRREFQTPLGPTSGFIKDCIEMGGHHPPLYFLLARVWTERFGSGVIAMRLLPALLSLLLLPAAYWLGLELFRSTTVARIAVILMAVSPNLVLHAQNAREYSLWIALVACTSAALLRAVRLQQKKYWLIYAVVNAVSLYTYSLSVFVSLAHCLSVFCTEKLRLTSVVKSQLQSTLLSFLLYSPWLVVMACKRHVLEDMAWLDKKISLIKLVTGWKNGFTLIFAQVPDPWLQGSLSLGLLAIAVVVACVFLRRAQRRQVIFITCLTACSILPLVVPDLVFGGFRSIITRYMMPAVIAVFLAFAFTISQMLEAAARPIRAAGALLLAAMIGCGIASCIANTTLAIHPQFSIGEDLASMARIINSSPKPVMVCNVGSEPGQTLAAVRLLADGVPLLLSDGPQIAPVPAECSEVYVFDPDPTKPFRIDPEFNVDRPAGMPFFGTLTRRGF